MRIIYQIIDYKLSVEYLLKLSNNFEALKKKTLNEEEYENFENTAKISFEDQMKEFNLNEN